MAPLQTLMDKREQDRLKQARRMHPLDKALAGADLFDTCRQQMALGVLLDDPGASHEQVEKIVRRRMQTQRNQR